MSGNADTPWKAIFLILILLVSFAGNVLVIMVVYRSRRSQWTTNHFVVSLAIINLLAPTFYLFLTLESTFRGQWLFGNVGCKLSAFLVHFNALTSVGMLCCMSFDRYYLTAYPLTFKLSKTQTKKVILAVWLLAILIACPMAYFYEIHSTNCLPEVSDEWTVYFGCFTIIFVLPHFITYATYLKVSRCIRARNNNRNGARFAQKVPRTKIKVTKLLIAQVIVYTVLWLPYIAYEMIVSISKDSTDKVATLVLTYLAYTSSAASPLVYSAFSADFRRGCKLIFIKYDASVAYRLPAQLERKNKVDVTNSDLGNQFPMLGSSEKRDSEEPGAGMTFFAKHRIAWSDV